MKLSKDYVWGWFWAFFLLLFIGYVWGLICCGNFNLFQWNIIIRIIFATWVVLLITAIITCIHREINKEDEE